MENSRYAGSEAPPSPFSTPILAAIHFPLAHSAGRHESCNARSSPAAARNLEIDAEATAGPRIFGKPVAVQESWELALERPVKRRLFFGVVLAAADVHAERFHGELG